MAARFCTQCGAQLDGNTRFCTNCGAPAPAPEPQPQQQYQSQQTYAQPQQTYTQPQPEPQPARQQPMMVPKPNSYLVWAILSTIFCCLPFGIVAIVQAAKVDGLWRNFQYEEAQEASDKAKKWVIIAAIVGIVSGIVYTVLVTKGVIAAGDLMNDYR